MNVYVVLNGRDVVAVSARLQGAELIRANHAARVATAGLPGAPHDTRGWQTEYEHAYDWMRIETHTVRDR